MSLDDSKIDKNFDRFEELIDVIKIKTKNINEFCIKTVVPNTNKTDDLLYSENEKIIHGLNELISISTHKINKWIHKNIVF
jgi:hypothetical protein